MSYRGRSKSNHGATVLRRIKSPPNYVVFNKDSKITSARKNLRGAIREVKEDSANVGIVQIGKVWAKESAAQKNEFVP